MAGERRRCWRQMVHAPAFASFDGVTGGMILDLSEEGLSMQTGHGDSQTSRAGTAREAEARSLRAGGTDRNYGIHRMGRRAGPGRCALLGFAGRWAAALERLAGSEFGLAQPHGAESCIGKNGVARGGQVCGNCRWKSDGREFGSRNSIGCEKRRWRSGLGDGAIRIQFSRNGSDGVVAIDWRARPVADARDERGDCART